jgi:hypothetical protein
MPISVPAEIWQKVQLILSQSDNQKMYRDAQGFKSAMEARRHSFNVLERPQYDFVNPQVELLTRLHATVRADLQESVMLSVIACAAESNAQVVAHTLVELREVKRLRTWERYDDTTVILLRSLTDKLVIEHWKFSDEDFESIGMLTSRVYASAKQRVNGEQPVSQQDWQLAKDASEVIVPSFGRVLTRVRYLRLADELLNLQNPAVDVDRRELLSRLDALRFTPSLTEALRELERKTIGAATKFDYKSAMELLRTFFEEFLEEASKKVAPKSSVPLPAGDKLSHFGTYNDYLKNAGITGREEHEMLGKLYAFLSNKGSHVLGSEPEQFHVARTTVIEWCMLLAGRVKRKVS